MGVPSLILNFDEIKQPFIDALEEADLQIVLDDVTIDTSAITLNTKDIETSLGTMITKLTDIATDTKLTSESIDTIKTTISDSSKATITEIKEVHTKLTSIIDVSKDIKKILEDIREQIASPGQMGIKGHMLDVPGLIGTYKQTTVFSNPVLITSVTISQSAWNANDSWNLRVGSLPVILNSYTKFSGEHKQFPKYFPVPANTDITVEFSNNVDSSKNVWYDISYIELIPVPPSSGETSVVI